MCPFGRCVQVVRCASPDTLPMVGQLIPLMINKLNETLQQQPGSPEAKERQSEVQVHTCPNASPSVFSPAAIEYRSLGITKL